MSKQMFLVYDVAIQIVNRLCGGTPHSPDVITGWLRAKLADQSTVEQVIAQTKEAMASEPVGTEPQESSYAWNGFKHDEHGLYIEGRQIKAAIKEAAAVLREHLGVTAFKARVAERVFVIEDRIYLGTDEPTGTSEGFVHAMSAAGPIHALKRTDYVDGPLTLTFTLRVLNEALKCKDRKPEHLTPEEYLAAIFSMGENLGVGAERSQGWGRYSLVSLQQRSSDTSN